MKEEGREGKKEDCSRGKGSNKKREGRKDEERMGMEKWIKWMERESKKERKEERREGTNGEKERKTNIQGREEESLALKERGKYEKMKRRVKKA